MAAVLPGGDPLAAALAAGETPSPQMVAAAGQIEGLKPKLALLCLAACVVGLVVTLALIIRTDALGRLSLDMSPDVLTQKARDIVSQLGYDPRAVDSAIDFDYDLDFKRWADENDKPRPQWNKILSERPAMLRFMFRQSSRYMIPVDLELTMTPGIVTFTDPATTFAGMINLMVDTKGRLVFFQALPPEVDASPAASKPMDWNPLFAAAGLNPSQFQAATPEWTSLANSDTRAAWTGKWPDSGRPLRIEASAWRGKPVFFQLIGPWTRPTRMRPYEGTRGKKIATVVLLTLFFLILVGASALAKRHYKQGKGDRQGAFRLARFVFLAYMAIWLCYGHFVPDIGVIVLFLLAVSTALFMSGLTWVLYMALEPYVRKLWPELIISWTRLMSGRVRDTLVGRDVLYGVMLGLASTLLFEIRRSFWITHLGTVP